MCVRCTVFVCVCLCVLVSLIKTLKDCTNQTNKCTHKNTKTIPHRDTFKQHCVFNLIVLSLRLWVSCVNDFRDLIANQQQQKKNEHTCARANIHTINYACDFFRSVHLIKSWPNQMFKMQIKCSCWSLEWTSWLFFRCWPDSWEESKRQVPYCAVLCSVPCILY